VAVNVCGKMQVSLHGILYEDGTCPSACDGDFSTLPRSWECYTAAIRQVRRRDLPTYTG
jgi:hypothetical protein